MSDRSTRIGRRRLLRGGRLATMALLGNHDYGPAWAHPELAGVLIETVAPFGITILRNDIREVEGLVLSHNPDTVDLPGSNGYEGWVLSGTCSRCAFNVRPEVTVFALARA